MNGPLIVFANVSCIVGSKAATPQRPPITPIVSGTISIRPAHGTTNSIVNSTGSASHRNCAPTRSSSSVARWSCQPCAGAPSVAPIVVGAASAAAEEAGGEGEKHISPPRVVGVGLYRGHALVLLSDGGGKGSGGEGGAAATLALVTADELPFSPPNTTDGVEKKGKGVAAARCRLVVSSSSFSSDASAAPPLAVSASRGVACALTAAGTRATVFDLEEDDEDEDEEEGGAEEGEEGGAKSSDYGDDDDDGDDHRRHHHESDDSSSLSDGSSGSGGMSSE